MSLRAVSTCSIMRGGLPWTSCCGVPPLWIPTRRMARAGSVVQVCFSHGKESGPWGSKINALARIARARAFEVESLDYTGIDDPGVRIELLTEYVQALDTAPLLVGSSMGGHVAATVAHRLSVRGLFVLAPAFFMPGYEHLTPPAPGCPITIVHGWHDAVVPWKNSLRYAEQNGARLLLVDGDHRLVKNLPEIETYFDLFLAEATMLP